MIGARCRGKALTNQQRTSVKKYGYSSLEKELIRLVAYISGPDLGPNPTSDKYNGWIAYNLGKRAYKTLLLR